MGWLLQFLGCWFEFMNWLLLRLYRLLLGLLDVGYAALCRWPLRSFEGIKMQTRSHTRRQINIVKGGGLRDLTDGILSKLPAKTLMRFKCVSKDWCSLIDDPQFIKIHATQVREDVSDYSIICTKDKALSLIGLISPSNPEKHGYSFQLGRRNAKLMGSCNGLVCLWLIRDTHIVLWNITTRKYNIIPGLPVSRIMCLYGFGYDSSSDDYKIVRVTCKYANDRSCAPEVDVFSLKTNAWRQSTTRTSARFFTQSLLNEVGSYCNGALHWMTSFRNRILTFGLTTEQCQEMALPDYLPSSNYIGSLRGNLCFTVINFPASFDVWVMKVYGVKESLSKLVTISLQPFMFEFPLSFSTIGDKILFKGSNENTIHIYDTKKGSVENLHGFGDTWKGFLYSGSLLAPAAPENVTEILSLSKKRRNRYTKAKPLMSSC
ncbi:hypothetical protein ACFE04_029797 [Oxalis oulophora]